MADFSKQDTTRTEVAEPYAAGKAPQSKFKRHCARWWWLHLLISAAILLVILLTTIYVAIPKIAQKEVNKATLEIQVQSNYDPTSQSVYLELVTRAHSDSKYHPTLDAFRAALYLPATLPNIKPFGYIDIPKQKVEKESIIMVNQTLQIADMEQFSAYTSAVLLNEEYQVGVRGRTGLKLGGLPKYDIDFDKIVTPKGLNKLKGFDVTSFDVHLPPLPDGSLFTGNAFIPNPSVLTIEMGNVTMDLSVKGRKIGQAFLDNLILRPGDNNVPMRTVGDVSTVLNTVISVGSVLPVDIVGNSSMRNGEHLEYYETAIRANQMYVELDLGNVLLSSGGSSNRTTT